MKRIFALALAILTLLSLPALAENYYVDAQNGSDSNSGTSPETAWKTLRNVKRQEFQPGDSILLHAGQVWRDHFRCTSSGEPGKPITYGVYGKGPKPALWGSVNMARPDFWKEVQPGIWATRADKIKPIRDYTEFETASWSCYSENKAKTKWSEGNDSKGRKCYSIKCLKPTDRDCDIQLNCASFKVPVESGLRFRFLIKLTGANGENLMTEEFASKFAGLARIIQARQPWDGYSNLSGNSSRLTKNGAKIEVTLSTTNFEEKEDGRLSFFFGPMLPEGSTFTICPLEAELVEIDRIGLFHDVGNIVMRRADADGNPTGDDVCGWKRWSVETLQDEGDYYHDLTTNVLYFKSEKNPATVWAKMEAACRCNLFDVGSLHDVVLDGWAFEYSGGHGVRGGTGAKRIIVRNCDFRWIGGSWLYTRGPIPTRYGNGIEFWSGNEDLLIEKNYFFQVYDTAMTNQGPDPGVLKNMVWRENRCEKCEQCYEIWLSSEEMTVESLVVEKNHFTDSGFGWSHAQRPDKRATHFLAYGFNCQVKSIEYRENYLGPSLMHMVCFSHPRIKEFKINRNTYDLPGADPNTTPLFYWGGLPSEGVSFEKYREMTGNDKDSVFKN